MKKELSERKFKFFLIKNIFCENDKKNKIFFSQEQSFNRIWSSNCSRLYRTRFKMKYLTFFLSILISLISLEFFVRIFIDNGFNYEIEMMKYANKLKIISENKSIGIEHKKNAKGKFMGNGNKFKL